MHSQMRAGTLPVLLALASAALFGAATPACKALLGNLSPFQLAGLLYLGAAIAMSPTVLGRNSRDLQWRMNRVNLLRLSGAVLFGGILGPVFLLVGLRLASAASVSLWLNLELVATALLGLLLFKDHLGPAGRVGVVGVVAASSLLSIGEGLAGLWAGLLVALACLCWGFDNHLTALIDGITPTQSTFWKGGIAGSVNLGIGVWLFPFNASATDLCLALVVGALCYGVSIALYIYAAQQVGATRAQMTFASAPFFGVLLSAVALGESFSAIQFTAAGVLALSLVLLFCDSHEHGHTHRSTAHRHAHSHEDMHHNHRHPGEPAALRHSHWHEHEEIAHTHPHWPDLHHRHDHHEIHESANGQD